MDAALCGEVQPLGTRCVKHQASNIKRARASLSEAMVNEFFDELTAGGVADVPPTNNFNFDETNFSDDPGAKKCFVRRSTR